MKILRIVIGTFLGLFGASLTLAFIATINATSEVGMPFDIADHLMIPCGLGQLIGAVLLPFKLRAGITVGTWATGAAGTIYATRPAAGPDVLPNVFFAALMLFLALALQAYLKPSSPMQNGMNREHR